MVTLSVIVPTVGRSSLRVTLQSILIQGLTEGDEVLCVGDGFCLEARKQWRNCRPPGRYLEMNERVGNWGHAQRNYAMSLARGTHLLSMDDDDVFTPGAFNAIRAALAEAPDRPHLFRMRMADGGLVWNDRELRGGNIGTPCIVVPNDPQRLGRWGDRYEGDWDFLESTLALYPLGAEVWREEVIALIRPADVASVP